MIPIYVSPPMDLVLGIGAVGFVVGFALVRVLHISFKPIHAAALLCAALAATGISLLYSYQFRGGDLFWARHGYPHYFWGLGSEIEYPQMVPGNLLRGFDVGPLGVYFFGDLIFYTGLLLCAYALVFFARDRIRSL